MVKQDARLQGRAPGFRGGEGVTGRGQDRTRQGRDGEETGARQGNYVGGWDQLVREGGVRKQGLRHLKALKV